MVKLFINDNKRLLDKKYFKSRFVVRSFFIFGKIILEREEIFVLVYVKEK